MTGPQAARFAARAVRGNFLFSGGAAAFAGRSCPSVFVFRQSRVARSPFGVMPRWSRDNFWFPAARRPLRAVCVRRSFFPVNPEPRGRPLGSCRVGLGTISVFPRLRGLLGWLHCVRRMGQFLVSGRFSVALVAPWPPRLRAIFCWLHCVRRFWEVLGRSGGALASPPAGNFLLGGDCTYGAPMSPHFCVQAGFDPPAKLACWGTLVYGVGLGPGLHFRPVPRVCPGGHCTPFGGPARHLKHKNLPDAGGTVIMEAVLSRRGPFIALRLG